MDLIDERELKIVINKKLQLKFLQMAQFLIPKIFVKKINFKIDSKEIMRLLVRKGDFAPNIFLKRYQ